MQLGKHEQKKEKGVENRRVEIKCKETRTKTGDWKVKEQ